MYGTGRDVDARKCTKMHDPSESSQLAGQLRRAGTAGTQTGSEDRFLPLPVYDFSSASDDFSSTGASAAFFLTDSMAASHACLVP